MKHDAPWSSHERTASGDGKKKFWHHEVTDCSAKTSVPKSQRAKPKPKGFPKVLMVSGASRYALVFNAFRDVGTKVLPLATSRIWMIISRNSPFLFGTLVMGYPLPTPNDIIFGLLGSQAPRMHPHLGWGPPKTPPLAPKVSRAGPGPDTSGHFWACLLYPSPRPRDATLSR